MQRLRINHTPTSGHFINLLIGVGCAVVEAVVWVAAKGVAVP